jgi:hypothetical protein
MGKSILRLISLEGSEKDLVEDEDVEGRIMLQCMLQKQEGV